MRKLVFDQFEFDSFASEESLEIDVVSKVVNTVTQFADLREFVAATVGPSAVGKLGSPEQFNDLAGFSSVRAYLKRFANINVPETCDWLMHVLLEDDLEWDGVFETAESYIRYHWSSTA
jgi:hypothetical protein